MDKRTPDKADIDRLDAKLDQISEDLVAIKHLVVGNGDPSKGLVLRQDRLEQTVARWSKLIGIAVGAGLLSLVGAFFKLVMK
ncbi:MAG: hypothetical protein JWN40_3845 [Phycisphaerales bacterium]|nr:hypothetical protein [Phycisphaerales bacterium]